VLGRPSGGVSNPRPPDDPEGIGRNERCTGFSSNACCSLGYDKRLPAAPRDAQDAELHDALLPAWVKNEEVDLSAFVDMLQEAYLHS
jgi:hypothetical protein